MLKAYCHRALTYLRLNKVLSKCTLYNHQHNTSLIEKNPQNFGLLKCDIIY